MARSESRGELEARARIFRAAPISGCKIAGPDGVEGEAEEYEIKTRPLFKK